MSKFTVGKEALSYCTKCKLSLSHIIVSMKDPNTIAKVKCKTCGAMHMFKDPSTKAKKVRSKSSTRGARSKSIPVADLWMEEMGKNKSKPKSYSIREKFEIGDIIDHKKFGPGIVQEFVDGNISVLFQHEIKTLVHNK
jgi:DNA-directed RNA polymerase subunit M/transcription elongation factor TFIIS